MSRVGFFLIWSSLLATASAHAAPGPGIRFHTRQRSGGSPGSTAAAVTSFAAQPDGVAGYGCALITTMLNQYNGIVIGGGKDSNVAYHVVSSFVVPAGQGGPWSLRWGPDWGWGGTLLVDGVELKSRWSAMWWNGNWNDANQQLQGTVTLTPGTHTVEVYGFEDCCDGVTDAQLMSPVGTWTDLTVASFNASAPPCGPDVTLAATAPATIAAGTQMTYRFDWANDGSATVNGASLSDTVPPNTTFVFASNGGSFDAGSGKVTWSLGNLASGAGGSVTLTVLVASPIANGTVIRNDTPRLVAGNAAIVSASAITTVQSAPRLSLTNSGAPNPVRAGAPLTFTLSYGNSGSDAAAAVTLATTVPANTSFLSATGSAGFDPASGSVNWTVGNLAAGASGTVSMTVQVVSPIANGTILSDHAVASATNGTAIAADASVSVSSAPGLALTNSAAPNPVSAGDSVTYTLRYGNSGTDAAAAATLVDALPANTSFVSASDGGSYDAPARQAHWTLGALAAGADATVTLVVRVDSPIPNGSILSDTASLTAAGVPSVLATSTVRVDSKPLLALTDRAAPNPVAAGASIAYTLAYGNGGSDGAPDALLAVVLPAGTSFGAASAGGEYDAGTRTVRWNLGQLAAGTGGTATLEVLVPSPIANGTVLSDQATLAAAGATSVLASASVSVTSAPLPALRLEATPSQVDAGRQLSFRVDWGNGAAASDAIVGAAVSATLPARMPFVSATGGGTYDAASHSVRWNAGTVAVGGGATQSVVVQVPADSADGTVLDGAALLSGTNIATLTATAHATVHGVAPDLSLPGPADAGAIPDLTPPGGGPGDAGPGDAGTSDAGPVPGDAGTSDAGTGDGGAHDAAMPGADLAAHGDLAVGAGDAGPGVGGGGTQPTRAGCGCSLGGAPSTPPAPLGLAVCAALPFLRRRWRR